MALAVDGGEILGHSREELIKIYPDLEETIKEREKENGALERYLYIPFKDGRKTLLIRYENSFVLEFQNLEGELTKIGLTREAMFSIFISYQFTMTPEQLGKEYENFQRF